MKVSVALIVSLIFASTNGIVTEEFNSNLAFVESEFSRLGPSQQVLNSYDELLRTAPENMEAADLNILLAKVWYKKAIIGLSLGIDNVAIEGFERSLALNPLNTAVKKNLLELLVKHGHRERLQDVAKYISRDDILYMDAVNQLNAIDKLADSGELDKLTEAINLSPLDPHLREKRIQITTEKIKSVHDFKDQGSLFADLVDDLSILTKINPAVNSENWNKLSEVYLFGLGEFSNALNANKKCLHYDMDNELCKKNSRFLNKYSSILTQLSHHSHYYSYLQEESDEHIELEQIDIKDLSAALVNPDKFLKIRRENESFRTNKEFILVKSSQFNSKFKLKSNALDTALYTSLAMDSLLRHDSKSWKKYSPHLSESSLPHALAIIDRALHSKDFPRAQQLISQLPKNMQKSSFVTKRSEKIQAHQQQQQQQQHRQYQQQYHQQHQQPRRPTKPKNDYYAILNIPRDSDERQVKKAYREASKQYHPDKYRGDLSPQDVENKMTQINMAYEVLSNPKLRKDYDLGIDPNDAEGHHQQQQHHAQESPFGAGSPFGSGGFNFQFGNGGGFQFGGMGGRQNRRRQT